MEWRVARTTITTTYSTVASIKPHITTAVTIDPPVALSLSLSLSLSPSLSPTPLPLSLSICLFLSIFFYRSRSLSLSLSLSLSPSLPLSLSLYLSVCLSVGRSVPFSLLLFFCLSICLSLCLILVFLPPPFCQCVINMTISSLATYITHIDFSQQNAEWDYFPELRTIQNITTRSFTKPTYLNSMPDLNQIDLQLARKKAQRKSFARPCDHHWRSRSFNQVSRWRI